MRTNKIRRRAVLAAMLLAGAAGLPMLPGTRAAHAQGAGEPIRIGLASDMSGPYASLGGPGTKIAAQLAIEDFGGKVLGRPVEVLQNDTRNKPDVGAGFVREWFERQNVRLVMDGSASSVGLAIQTLAQQNNRLFISTGSFTSELVGAPCTPTTIQFISNTRGLAVAGLQQAMADGVKSFYFVTPDYAFGKAMQADASNYIRANGGKVIGAALHPLGQTDLSAYLVEAKSSGAQALAIASAGADLVNAVKQVHEFGLDDGSMRIYGLLVNLSDVEALGSEAQGLRFATSIYWNLNDKSRSVSERFMARSGGHQPTMVQAMTYSATLAYLRAVQAAGTDDNQAVIAKLRAMPVNDAYVDNAMIRADGRLMNDLYVARVRKAGEVKDPRDTVEVGARIPADLLYGGESACPLLRDAK